MPNTTKATYRTDAEWDVFIRNERQKKIDEGETRGLDKKGPCGCGRLTDGWNKTTGLRGRCSQAAQKVCTPALPACVVVFILTDLVHHQSVQEDLKPKQRAARRVADHGHRAEKDTEREGAPLSYHWPRQQLALF